MLYRNFFGLLQFDVYKRQPLSVNVKYSKTETPGNKMVYFVFVDYLVRASGRKRILGII